jgi:hypothetical protein
VYLQYDSEVRGNLRVKFIVIASFSVCSICNCKDVIRLIGKNGGWESELFVDGYAGEISDVIFAILQHYDELARGGSLKKNPHLAIMAGSPLLFFSGVRFNSGSPFKVCTLAKIKGFSEVNRIIKQMDNVSELDKYLCDKCRTIGNIENNKMNTCFCGQDVCKDQEMNEAHQNDYTTSCPQCYAHSEVAIALLFGSEQNVRIKSFLPMCPNCRNFWSSRVKINGNIIKGLDAEGTQPGNFFIVSSGTLRVHSAVSNVVYGFQ